MESVIIPITQCILKIRLVMQVIYRHLQGGGVWSDADGEGMAKSGTFQRTSFTYKLNP